MTHVTIPEDLLPVTYNKQSLLSTDIGSVTAYDFALANTSYEARVAAVTRVASTCYGNPKSLGSISLFNRLQAEAAGLPSSSYEFVPVLLKLDTSWFSSRTIISDTSQFSKVLRLKYHNCFKYGQTVVDSTNDSYLLTNLRALIEDVGPEESLKYFNTSQEEIDIIRANFKVFLFNVDLATRAQMVRHRVSWQELSRRYVSGKKTPFEFYISDKMATIESCDYYGDDGGASSIYNNSQDIIDMCVNHYDAAIAAGIKPEEARRILPQAMMTTIWGAFLPYQLANFFTLRLDPHAQHEIRLVAEAMKESV